MKHKNTLRALVLAMLCSCTSSPKQEVKTLKDAYASKFHIGAALNVDQIMGRDEKSMFLVKNHFNSIVAEDCMKSENIQPKENEFFFEEADKFVEFGEQNNMFIVGHTLIWHSQAPAWFFVDEEGNDVSREVMIERMRNHIYTIVGRYKGRVHGWDVVNEAIEDDGSFRNSKFLQIIGEDYLKLAFQFTHDADPEAQLYYNDYSMDKEGKRNTVIKLAQSLKDAGLRIDAIGMQTHAGLNHPNIVEYEKSLSAFAGLGLKVMATEFDVTVLPSPWEQTGAEISLNFDYTEESDPFKNGQSADNEAKLANRYIEFFKLFNKYSNDVTRVTFWGVTDNQSWRNNWPIKGRTDYALPYDRNYQAKAFVEELIELSK